MWVAAPWKSRRWLSTGSSKSALRSSVLPGGVRRRTPHYTTQAAGGWTPLQHDLIPALSANMHTVRKRVMRFSPSKEEDEEVMLMPLVKTSSFGLDAGKKRRVGELEHNQEFRDIVSVTIMRQLWHVADRIFKHLDAVSLLHCEKVRYHRCKVTSCRILNKEKSWIVTKKDAAKRIEKMCCVDSCRRPWLLLCAGVRIVAALPSTGKSLAKSCGKICQEVSGGLPTFVQLWKNSLWDVQCNKRRDVFMSVVCGKSCHGHMVGGPYQQLPQFVTWTTHNINIKVDETAGCPNCQLGTYVSGWHRLSA